MSRKIAESSAVGQSQRDAAELRVELSFDDLRTFLKSSSANISPDGVFVEPEEPAPPGTMVALDKPDTRSWTTMPDRVYIARTWLPAGKHHIKIATVGGVQGARSIKEVDVEIPADGFAAIDFTTLR